jgi:hypothetical protein
LPDAAFTILLTELERSPDSIPTVPNLSPEDAAQFKESLDSMYAVRAYHDVPLEEFASDISEAFTSNKELELQAEPSFRGRLTKLLNITALRVSAKATLLHAEYEHSFCTARILSDIRPVYDNGVKGAPSGAIIMHTLKLSYHEGATGGINEIYISMGSDDVAELQRVLERATDKATSLKRVLEAGQLRYIDPQQ